MSLNRCTFWYEADGKRLDFTFYGGFPVDYPSGVDGLNATVSTIRSMDGIGADVQLAQVPERPISFTGYIITADAAQETRLLHRMFAPMKKGRLYARSQDCEVFYLDCYSSAEPTVEGKKRLPRFLVQLTAGYPYWQSVDSKIMSLSMTGAGSTSAVNVDSDVDAVYSAVFSCTGGSCKNLALTDKETGLSLRYSGTLDADERLVVTISEFGRVAAAIGDRNVIGLFDADLKKIPAGNRVLELTAEENSGTVTAEITYREGRAGV